MSTLTVCRDCGHEVSRHAQQCPQCGCPMAPTMIEQTAKPFKLTQVIGLVIFAAGFALALFFGPNKSHAVFCTTWTVATIGIVTAVIGAGLAWWYHG